MSQILIELKKVALEKMHDALQQIHHLQIELLDIVELNNQLSKLSEKEVSSILYEMDPELISLRNSFVAFTKNYQQYDDKALIKIHQGIKQSLKEQTEKILAFSGYDTKIEEEDIIQSTDIIKSTEALKKSSKTIASIESLLIQRKVTNYTPTIYSTAQQKFSQKINELEGKEKNFNHIVNVIQNVSPQGELNEDFQNLIHNICQGESLEKIEEQFHIEEIELFSDQQASVQPDDNVERVMNSTQTDELDEKSITTENKVSLSEHFHLFLLTLLKWLHTPSNIGWQQCKTLTKTKNRNNKN